MGHLKIDQSISNILPLKTIFGERNSIHGILQPRILEWVYISFSKGSYRPRDWTQVSSISGRFFTICVTRVALQRQLQFNSVAQSCSTPWTGVMLQSHGLQHSRLPPPSPPQNLLKLVHQVSDAIQPSHLLSSPSPPAFHLSRHQGLF